MSSADTKRGAVTPVTLYHVQRGAAPVPSVKGPNGIGEFHDTLVRTAEGWKIAHRKGVAVFLIFFCAVLFFAPELGGWFLEHDNFVPANILQTPPEIVPEWLTTTLPPCPPE